VENTIGQILQSALKQLGIIVTFKTEDTSTEFTDIQANKHQLAFSYWTMDIADPDELVTFAIDPKGGAFSFYTHYNNPAVTKLSHQAQREVNPQSARFSTRSSSGSPHPRRTSAICTTRRTDGRTRASCTASSSSRSATTTSRTPGWVSVALTMGEKA